jgi:hypothetical protein
MGIARVRSAYFLPALAGLALALAAPVRAGAAVGIWTSAEELAALPTSGKAWDAVLAAANEAISDPKLSDQEDPDNVRVMARALVFARTGEARYRDEVVAACRAAIGTEAGGRTLALGRELAAYVIAADLVGLPADLEASFRAWLDSVRKQELDGRTLVSTHEDRPNNWGTHAGASRIAVALYLGDRADLERAARVFRGWLGDRASYAGFEYGELDWQADPANPVGINPVGSRRDGHSLDGVLPDDQRRAGAFVWPPPKENYVWEALQGALAQAVMLERAGYDVWSWSDRALLRAATWLHTQASFPAEGDDTFSPWILNRAYGTSFPAPLPSRPGKNVGFTDWTFGAGSSGAPAPVAACMDRVDNDGDGAVDYPGDPGCSDYTDASEDTAAPPTGTSGGSTGGTTTGGTTTGGTTTDGGTGGTTTDGTSSGGTTTDPQKTKRKARLQSEITRLERKIDSTESSLATLRRKHARLELQLRALAY